MNWNLDKLDELARGAIKTPPRFLACVLAVSILFALSVSVVIAFCLGLPLSYLPKEKAHAEPA